MTGKPDAASIRDLLASVAEPETPEERDEAWNKIERALRERDAYHSALERILNRYHDRPLTGIDPELPFHMKEIALKVLTDAR